MRSRSQDVIRLVQFHPRDDEHVLPQPNPQPISPVEKRCGFAEAGTEIQSHNDWLVPRASHKAVPSRGRKAAQIQCHYVLVPTAVKTLLTPFEEYKDTLAHVSWHCTA